MTINWRRRGWQRGGMDEGEGGCRHLAWPMEDRSGQNPYLEPMFMSRAIKLGIWMRI